MPSYSDKDIDEKYPDDKEHLLKVQNKMNKIDVLKDMEGFLCFLLDCKNENPIGLYHGNKTSLKGIIERIFIKKFKFSLQSNLKSYVNKLGYSIYDQKIINFKDNPAYQISFK